MVPEFSPTEMEYFLWNKNGLDLIIRAVEELIQNEVLHLSKLKNGKHLIAKGDRFNEKLETKYQKLIRGIVRKYYIKNVNHERLKQPALTPLYLIDKIYYACDKRFKNYKTQYVFEALRNKGMMDRSFFGQIIISSKGKPIRKRLLTRLEELKRDDSVDFQSAKDILGDNAIILPELKTKTHRDLRMSIKETNINSFWSTLFKRDDSSVHGSP